MFRVITSQFDHRRTWVIEKGPWHPSREHAEYWREQLASVGYNAKIETQHGDDHHGAPAGEDNSDLMQALASMA